MACIQKQWGLLGLLVLILCGTAGCGGAQSPVRREETLQELRQALGATLDSPAQVERTSRLVESVVEDRVLHDMRREEVREALGPGEPCGRRPRCADNGFDPGDWFYTVGSMGEAHAAQPPLLIVGFDGFGHVSRVWNLRVH